MIVIETKVSVLQAKDITDRLLFDGAIHANNIGFTGGLWLLWDSAQVEVNVLSSIEQEIHAIVKDLSLNASWMLSVVYASPRYAEKRLLWDNLTTIAGLHSLPWVIVGNFNEILLGENKFGGRPINVNRALKFQECLNDCGMIDLGFTSPKYTWSNHRPLTHLIQERIDRVFANTEWNIHYPNAQVKHLERTHFDHSSVILSLNNSPTARFPRLFRFQLKWLSHSTFPRIVREAWVRPVTLPNTISSFISKAKAWNRDQFGNIFHCKRRICARLQGIQIALGVRPSEFLIDLEKTLKAGL
ncbi:uncharacterized protein LOC142644001 [Castanea sativa]|uniref:uncharacterized protein LOC142644001 n=1 Tax=Castanea sativa TaxID=21020 RepID=UPI003F651C93